MSDLDDIYSALMSAKEDNDALGTWMTGWRGHEAVQRRRVCLEIGIKAYNRLSMDLCDGRKHLDRPDNYSPTGCECGVPGAMPPCGYCSTYSEDTR